MTPEQIEIRKKMDKHGIKNRDVAVVMKRCEATVSNYLKKADASPAAVLRVAKAVNELVAGRIKIKAPKVPPDELEKYILHRPGKTVGELAKATGYKPKEIMQIFTAYYDRRNAEGWE